MKAIIYDRYGPPSNAILREIPRPTPGPGELLLKVRASSLNAYDWHVFMADPFFVRFSMGLTRPKNPTPGADVAGVVEALGPGVTEFQPGDAVYGDTSAAHLGGLAEYVTVPVKLMARKPDYLSFEEAAAIPMAGLTALQGVRDEGGIQPGMRVLINGASGGVGTFAVQIAKALGAEVTAVCSTRKVEQARELGADYVIDYTSEDFTRNGQQYDLILGANGDYTLSDYERALAPGGIYVMAGGSYRQIFSASLFGGRKSRANGKQYRVVNHRPVASDLLVMNELVAQGLVRPVVDRCYPLAEAQEAMAYLVAGHAKGKIVVTPA